MSGCFTVSLTLCPAAASTADEEYDSDADSRDSFDQAPSAKELLLINRMDLPKELQVKEAGQQKPSGSKSGNYPNPGFTWHHCPLMY
jgi:hypothetical protein